MCVEQHGKHSSYTSETINPSVPNPRASSSSVSVSRRDEDEGSAGRERFCLVRNEVNGACGRRTGRE